MNYKLTIQYDGTDFHGWQVQENDRTIQGEIERVISTIEGEPVRVTGSGRTDAGVHAEGQVANVVLNKSYTPNKLQRAINGNLWRDIRIMNVEEVPDEFHARFSAPLRHHAARGAGGRSAKISDGRDQRIAKLVRPSFPMGTLVVAACARRQPADFCVM